MPPKRKSAYFAATERLQQEAEQKDKTESPETQASELPNAQHSESVEVKHSNIQEAEHSNISKVQRSSIPEYQNSESLKVLTSESQDATIEGKRYGRPPVKRTKERKQQTVYLPVDIIRWLKVQSATTDKEISDIVTEALERYRSKAEE